MAGIQTLDVNLRIANEDQVAAQLSGIVGRGGEEGGQKSKSSGSNASKGLGQALATGASTALFSRFADALKSLETSIGGAFDASTSAAEKQGAILEGLGATISPALAAAVRAAVGPQVETEQQTISRVLSQLQSAAEAIALSQPKDASSADVKKAVGDRLRTQITALSEMERRRAQGSVALQQVLAANSQGLDGADVLSQAAKNVQGAAKATGLSNPLLDAALSGFQEAGKDQKGAAKAMRKAAEAMLGAVGGVGGSLIGRPTLGLDGSE